MPRSPQWIDLYQIWFRGSSRGLNQLCGILLQSAHGFRFYEGSKFAISHWLGRSPLTQCWRYRAASDELTSEWEEVSQDMTGEADGMNQGVDSRVGVIQFWMSDLWISMWRWLVGEKGWQLMRSGCCEGVEQRLDC